MKRIARALVLTALAVLVAGYLAFSHLISISDNPDRLMLLAGLTPLTVLALLAAWNSRLRWLALALILLLGFAVVRYLDEIRHYVSWLYFAQHAGAMSLLAITFGGSLGSGDANALCSRVARLLLPSPVDPAYMRYTWKVTLVWTCYFVLSALLSVVLFFFGPITVWSYFANLLTPVLVGLMFVVEYLVRVRVLPARAHFSVAQTIRAYRLHEHR